MLLLDITFQSILYFQNINISLRHLGRGCVHSLLFLPVSLLKHSILTHCTKLMKAYLHRIH